MDFHETFFHVTKLNSVQVLSLAVHMDWPLYQLGVKNTFLHGDCKRFLCGNYQGMFLRGESYGVLASKIYLWPKTFTEGLV